MIGLVIHRDGRFVDAPVLAPSILKIGRVNSCHVLLTDDAEASRMHAVIELSDPPAITDLGSAAGTQVNGEPIRRAALSAGDSIRVGAHVLTVIAIASEPSAEPVRVEVARSTAATCARMARAAVDERRWTEAQMILGAGWRAVSDPQWLGFMQELALLGDAAMPDLRAREDELLRARLTAGPAGFDDGRLWLDAAGLGELRGLRRALLPMVRARGEASGAAIWQARTMELEIGLTPEDDAPRQVHADWLLELGDPRGEFIAIQLITAREAGGPAAVREAELWRLHGTVWSSTFADFGAEVEFRRGFPSCVRYDGVWPDELIALVRDTPTLERVEGRRVPKAIRSVIPGPSR